ncbi:MAG: hypothetical protein U9N32_00735, partial [Spirochaetota bacterium]|nr:hypothetical protein [Spirochaetota bacterium]
DIKIRDKAMLSNNAAILCLIKRAIIKIETHKRLPAGTRASKKPKAIPDANSPGLELLFKATNNFATKDIILPP